MLFDLRGKRRRLIQTIYVFLALLLGGGLVFFGIGGDAPGGLGELFGVDTQSQRVSQDNPEFERRIEALQERLALDPEDEETHVELIAAYFSAGRFGLETDEHGNETMTESSAEDFKQTTRVWERYIESDPQSGELLDRGATLAFQAYASLLAAERSVGEIRRLSRGASETAQILADSQDTATAWERLAFYAYIADQPKIAERAERRALAEADDTLREQLEQGLRVAKRDGRQITRQLDAGAGAEQLTTPVPDVGAAGRDTGQPLPTP